MIPQLLALAAQYIAPAIASSAVGGAINAAMPKKGMTTPGQAPSMDQMDFNSLLAQPQQAQAQNSLPKLQLQNRLPRGY